MDSAKLACWVRERLLDYLPDWLDFIPSTWPDWALFAAAPLVIVVVLGLALDRIFDVYKKSKKGLQDAGRLVQGKSIGDPSPATEEGQAEIQALLEQTRAENAAMRAQIDAVLSYVMPASGAARLSNETEAAKKAAVVKLVTDVAPAAQEAARDLAQGDVLAGFDALAREARLAEAEAAEKWRRLGALATGVDTARARAAYEEAFKLQPEDFWTCVELARLRDRVGDTDAAREVAAAAINVARDERQLAVAKAEVANVHLKLGDLRAARRGYEEADAAFKRLAEKNPGSAEAQRDLIFSYANMGSIYPQQGWWAKGLVVCQRLASEGRLAPADAWMLDDLRKRAAEDG